jgi:hypothetical protein
MARAADPWYPRRVVNQFSIMQAQSTIASTGARARDGLAAPTVEFRNCRHPFGGALRFDVVVNGAYPDRSACIMLTQNSKVAYLSVPTTSISDARAVVGALGSYQLSCVFRKGEPIMVGLAWPGAPEVNWQISY